MIPDGELLRAGTPAAGWPDDAVTPPADLAEENDLLRLRVAELERKLARSSDARPELGTALAEREALLAEVEKVAHMGSWIWDVPSDRVAWSDGLFHILGYEPTKDAPTTEAFFARVHPEDVAGVRERSRKGVTTGVSERQEFRVLRPDGQVRHVTMDGALLFDQAGRLQRAVGTVVDRTDRLELEQRVQHAQKLDAVGQVATGIAHDFNNLLTVILGGLDGLRGGADPAQALSQIEGAARAASTLTRRLLAFTRPPASATPGAPGVVDACEVVRSLQPLLDRSLGGEVTVRLACADRECGVRLDENELSHLLLNLCVNARDAMDGRGRIDVTVATLPLRAGEVAGLVAGEYVRVSVTDTGRGMDETTLSRIFEPFFSTKPPGAGTGLGLTVVRETVARVGGAVVVSSNPGLGATFHVYLPRAPLRAAAPPPARLKRKLRVLLVDDDAAVRRAEQRALEFVGCTVRSVGSGLEAMALWESDGPFDVLVTDAAMPAMRGEQLADELLGRDSTLRVLMVTGHLALGMKPTRHGDRIRVLEKPFRAATLEAALSELTGS